MKRLFVTLALIILTVVSILIMPGQVAHSEYSADGRTVAIGLRVDLLSGNPAAVINASNALNTDWLQQDVRWADIEPQPGQYNWAALDAAINAVSPHGIQLMLSISGTPTWARPAGVDLTKDGPPQDPNTFATFVYALATRYAGRVQAYEIWPAPNSLAAWETPGGPLAAGYLDLLRPAAQVIRAADPTAAIISGGLLPAAPNANLAVDDQAFLSDLYAGGLAQYVDAIGLHLTPHENAPADTVNRVSDPNSACTTSASCFFTYYETLQAVKTRAGDASRPLWVTRVSWAVALADQPGITAEQQAEYLAAAVSQIQAAPYVAGVIISHLNLNWSPSASLALQATSLTNADQTVRPAFVALVEALRPVQPTLSLQLPPAISRLANWSPRLQN